MLKKWKGFWSSLGNLFWGWKEAFKASPFFVISKIISGSTQALQDLIQSVFLLAFLLSCIEQGRSFKYALYYIIAAASIITAKFLFDGFAREIAFTKGKEKILRSLTLKLYEKAVKMDMSFYDDPKFYNDFVWSMNDAPAQIILSFDLLQWVVYMLVTALVTGVYIATEDTLGVIVVVFSVILRIIIHIISVRREVKMQEEMKPHQRKRDYINRVFYLSDFAKDIRLSDIKNMLFKSFEKSSDDMGRVVKKHSKVLVALTVLYYSVTTAALNMYLVWLLAGYFYFDTIETLGTVVSMHNAINRLSNSLSNLANVIPQVQKTGLYVAKMRKFLSTENLISDSGKKQMPESFDISFKDVSFCYPGSEKTVLKNINLDIKAGSKIALVGYNGAGKSTLVKLMMRLYDPTSGEIKLGESNIMDFPLSSYRGEISTLFQDFQIMAATLGENITMSDEPIDEKKAENMLSLTGFDAVYSRLKGKLNTPLTKEFNKSGANFSGGESQKIAIARVLYSDARLLILDEPSAALDPLSEYTLNHTINELAKDRTIIFISHRLSTTRLADKIYMLENGEIIEEGSHDELISKGGKYAEMFLLQAQKYR